jgi:hypothetical protein
MNWYKKANLQETLPYFQEFEDMGDFMPQEESVKNVLENQFGASIVSDIGQGDSGVAYSLSNGDVLKITTNSQEGEVARYFWMNGNNHVVDYKLVWKEGDLYYIVMDKIETMAASNPEISSAFEYINNITNKAKCYNPECTYEIVKEDTSINESLKQEILSYLSSLAEISIPMFDFLNINNVGIKDGKLVFFDIT